MHAREHSTVREGLIAGLMGAAILAAWYFVYDAAAGRPFYTPNALGSVLFRGDLELGVRGIVPQVVAGYTLLHVVVFVLAGIGLTLLVHLAARNLALRMGLWIGLVVTFAFFAGLTYMLTTASHERLPVWPVVGGTLLAVVAMVWYLLRRHPRVTTDSPPLGAEVKSTTHPPGAPRG